MQLEEREGRVIKGRVRAQEERGGRAGLEYQVGAPIGLQESAALQSSLYMYLYQSTLWTISVL